MRLFNFRSGFACNSSSTHSIIKNFDRVTDEFSEYGWDWFSVAPTDVNRYIMASVVSDGRPYDRTALGAILDLPEDAWDDAAYADHQSLISMVADPVSGAVSPLFVADLYTWFKSNNAGVLGGNDNSDEPEWTKKYSDSKISVPSPVEQYGMVGRKVGSTWTAINPRDGTKVRFSFDAEKPDPSLELVDMKITGYCTFGCQYCYQGSTKDGAHADKTVIFKALKDCADNGVLEVAFGGGEPTMHPDFKEIVSFAKKVGIVPNVTTRNLSFIRQMLAGQWDEVGGVAFSVDTDDAVNKICGAIALGIENREYRYQRITVQIVDRGVRYKPTLECMLDKLAADGVRVTWLGFKESGFGGKYIKLQYNQPDWSFATDVLPRKEYSHFISVDTAMLSKYGALLRQKYGGDSYRITATEQEGRSSCYIDCCEGVLAKSSYHMDARQKYISLKSQFKTLAG